MKEDRELMLLNENYTTKLVNVVPILEELC
jgi:hypothetical protein